MLNVAINTGCPAQRPQLPAEAVQLRCRERKLAILCFGHSAAPADLFAKYFGKKKRTAMYIFDDAMQLFNVLEAAPASIAACCPFEGSLNAYEGRQP